MGNGPVSALDAAVRKALLQVFPAMEPVHLVDYKVRIINSQAGSDAAVRALIEKGTSLLPVGVVSCDGAFPAGEAVLVVGPDGREVGKGIAGLSAEEIRAVRGMRSEEALGLLPGGSTEVIHRDRFAPAVR